VVATTAFAGERLATITHADKDKPERYWQLLSSRARFGFAKRFLIQLAAYTGRK